MYVPQVNGLVTLIVAAVLGGTAGYLGIQGLSLYDGVVAGLSAVGAVSVADRVKGE